MKAIMQKITTALCFVAAMLAVTAFLISLAGQFYWIWGAHWVIWDLNRLKLLMLAGCALLLMFGGLIKLADVYPRATVSTSCLLLLTYSVRFVDLSAWAPQPYRTSGQYTFTTDWVTANHDLWSKNLAALKGRSNIRALEVGSFEGVPLSGFSKIS